TARAPQLGVHDNESDHTAVPFSLQDLLGLWDTKFSKSTVGLRCGSTHVERSETLLYLGSSALIFREIVRKSFTRRKEICFRPSGVCTPTELTKNSNQSPREN